MSLIEVRRLVKRFGYKTALEDLDFQANPGEFVALLGPNGAGKTTFIRILASLTRPTSGEIRISGYRLSSRASSVRRLLGVVSHQPLLYGGLTAEENLHFFCKLYDVKNPEKRVREVLGLIGLEKRRRDLLHTYSRGMQQRLAIGRAILHNPEVILLDEPHTGLDQEACAVLDQLLREVAARGRTVVMTSHDIARAAALAMRFEVLFQGKIVASTRADSMQAARLMSFYRRAITKDAEMVEFPHTDRA